MHLTNIELILSFPNGLLKIQDQLIIIKEHRINFQCLVDHQNC